MNESRGANIARAFLARMADLTVANGYSQNAGQNVEPISNPFIERSPDTLPACVLYPGDSTLVEDVNEEGLTSQYLSREFVVEVAVEMEEPFTKDSNNWFFTSEAIVRDVNHAILNPSSDPEKNWRLGSRNLKRITMTGSITNPPAEGVTQLLVAVSFSVFYVEPSINL